MTTPHTPQGSDTPALPEPIANIGLWDGSPDSDAEDVPVYTADQMQAYAEAYARAPTPAPTAGEPVATVGSAGIIYNASALPLPIGTKLYAGSAPTAGEWLDIETAPKDGTAILLGSRGGAWIGKWLPVYGSGYVPDNKWSSLMLNHDHMGEKWQPPTHWQPLPNPPGATK